MTADLDERLDRYQGRTFGASTRRAELASMASVEADALTLAQLLTYAALLAATCEYVEIMKRRQSARVMVAERAEIEQAGLEGLVRLFLVNDEEEESGSARRGFRRFGRLHRRHRPRGRRRSAA